MTDYNDGKWHGWNGGKCPVHPKSVVEWTRFTGVGTINVPYQGMGPAGSLNWDVLTAFRVIKPYRAPREWWVRLNFNGALLQTMEGHSEAFRVREVTED